MWAVPEGHAEVARFLLDKGAFVDFCDIVRFIHILNHMSKTSLL